MLFLLLAMLFSAVLAMVLKYLNTSSPYGVFFFNYITCTVLAFAAMEPRTLYNGDFTPCWLGGITGLIYLASLSANGYSIHKNGAILSSVFTRLGVLVPILVSVALFGERPTALQGLGVALAVAAAVVMNGLPGRSHDPAAGTRIYLVPLVLTLLLNGAADAMSKVFTQLGRRQDDGLFMFYIFLFAGLATLVLLVKEHRPHPAACLPGLPFLQRGGHPRHQRGQLPVLPRTAEQPPAGGGGHDPGGAGAAQPVKEVPALSFARGKRILVGVTVYKRKVCRK